MPKFLDRSRSRKAKFLSRIFLCALTLVLLGSNYASADVYDWLGATSSDVTVASNWSDETTHTGGVPGSGDDVYVGVNATYQYYLLVVLLTGNINLTTMPVVTVNTTWKSLTFGYNGPTSSYIDGSNSSGPTSGIMYNILLMVNSNITLTVLGNVTQNHNPSVRGTPNNYLTTTIGGLGTLNCQGNFIVGDATTKPDATVADVTKVALQINQLTITGNIVLNSNGNGTKAPNGNAGICYPLFSVEKGITTLQGQMTFFTNNFPLLSGYNIYNPGQPGYLGQSAYQGYGEIEADNNANSPNTFELQNKLPIVKTDNFYVFFAGGGNSGTVLYDDPNNENQTVYTANEPSATTTATYVNIVSPSYYNLTLSGVSAKVVDKNSTLGSVTQGLVVGNNLTTSGGVVNLTINNPTVTVGGGWTNSTTVTQGTGNITTGGFVTNSSTITGSTATIKAGGLFTNTGIFTCGTGSVTFQGGYINNATFTTNATCMIYFTGTQTLQDNTTAGTKFYNVTFNSPGSTATTATMKAGVGNFTLVNTGILTMVSPAQLVAGTTTVGGAAYLTLASNNGGTATIAPITGTSTISGNVNVQRHITGDGVTAGYLGYRMLTSPVNVNNVTSQTSSAPGYMSLNYLGAGMETGGPLGTANGFDATTTNPLIYFYAENRPQSYAAYISGKNVGVYSINSGNTVTTYGTTLSAAKTTASVPVGNSYQIFFVGTPTDGINANIPHAATITALGYLNQGTIPVQMFNGVSSSTTLTYTTGTGAPIAGLTQAGNPYASTIDLDSVYFDNKTSLSNMFYIMTTPGTTFVTYNASTHTASSTAAGPYIASGQGFFVGALPTASSLTFYEKEKVSVQLTPTTTPPLQLSQRLKTPTAEMIPAEEMLPTGLAGLHLQMAKDSMTNIQTGIYFSKQWSDNYIFQEDAINLNGPMPVLFLSSYSNDGYQLSINEMSDYSKGKTVKLFVSSTASGTFTLGLADIKNIDPNYNVYLRDHKLNDSVNLRTAATYSFTINKSDTTTFGSNRFDLVVEPRQLLPYLLVSFTGEKVTTGIHLTWNVNNPGTYTGFVLQKQGSDGSYTPVYSIQSNNNSIYNYIDTSPTAGNNTYRLAQSDFFGNITYSAPVTIGYNNVSAGGYFTVYPNPSPSIINVKVNSTDPSQTSYIVDIYNSSGTLMDQRTSTSYSWTQDISSYKIGVYMITLKNANGDVLGMKKIIKTN